MATRKQNGQILSDSSDEDKSETESVKSRELTSASVYSTEDSNDSWIDSTGIPEEEDFSQEGKPARRPPNISSDSEDARISYNQPRNVNDAQYSSDEVVEMTSSSGDENDVPRVQIRSAKRRKEKRRPPPGTSDSSEGDRVISKTDSDSPRTEESDDSLSSAETSCDTWQSECGSSQLKESYVSTKKYKKLRVGLDSWQDRGKKKLSSPRESATTIKDLQQLHFVYGQLKNKIVYGNVEEIRGIIFGSSFVELSLAEFSELLWNAVLRGKNGPAVASLLVKARVDVNLGGPGEYSDSTILHVVAEKIAFNQEYEGLASLLLSSGADINRCNGQGNSVLFSAVKGGSAKLVEELMQLGVQLGERYNRVLREAAKRPCNVPIILPLLIEYKAEDKDTQVKRAMLALRALVYNGSDAIAIKLLLSYSLPLDQLDAEGQTLLHLAVIASNVEMVRLLLEHGADPRKKRKDGSIPLWHAARQQSSEITGLLIKHGASVHDSNDNGYFPIHAACNAVSARNIRLLLHLGADVNVTDALNDSTPFATMNKHVVLNKSLNDSQRFMIQHFALLTSKNVKIHRHDLITIREFSTFRKYYTHCLSELEQMKKFIIYEGISLYCILISDIDKISHLVRNSELIDEYYKSQEKIKDKCRTYSSMLRNRIKVAWHRKGRLQSMENEIKEISNNVLNEYVCEKIAYFACYDSFIDFDLKCFI